MDLRRIALSTLLACVGCSAAPPSSVATLPADARLVTHAVIATHAAEDDEDADDGSALGAIVLWLPNRVFDLLDVVRLRLRVGPGLGAGVRVTELADVNLGAWSTLFVGIPGPRGEPEINWPFGFETLAGAELSVVDVSTEDDDHAPRYGPAEVGLGIHLAILGLDIGVEPWEAVDFIVGLVFFDPVGDDL
ncbi:MAG: hypothetical protein JNL94_07160 [Planctomycetes bacterium]|nr:hypothetical protein [Planctomycetota bacterium]